MPTISPNVIKMYEAFLGENAPEGAAADYATAVALHEAAHAVVAAVTMGNPPKSLTIEPDDQFVGLHVHGALLAISLAHDTQKRAIRRAMVALAPLVFEAPYDLFAKSTDDFAKYVLDDKAGYWFDARQAITILSPWYDDPQERVVIIRRIASRTKVLLSHPLVRAYIRDTASRLLSKPTLYSDDLVDVMLVLLSERQSIMSWMRAKMRVESRQRDAGGDGN